MTSGYMRNSVRLGALILLGISIRLIVLPFSMPNEEDAIYRAFGGQMMLLKPRIITNGVWCPLYDYLIACAMWFWTDPVFAPIAVNIIFAVVTAIPLYIFVKNEWDEFSGLFVAGAYLFYPVAIRYSLMAVAEIPFCFYVFVALACVSMARRDSGNWKHVVIGGIALTLSGALRYEGWILIPLLAIPLYKKPRLLIVFILTSLLFPVYWMSGNYIHNGDVLYGVHFAAHYQIVVQGYNANIIGGEIIWRAIYYPLALLFGITPAIATLCIIGIIKCIMRRKKQCIWLIPFICLLIIYIKKAIDGSLLLKARYSILLALFLLPFAAEVIGNIKRTKYRIMASIILIASMLPLSYIRGIGYNNTYVMSKYIPRALTYVPVGIEAIPKLNKSASIIADYLATTSGIRDGGLILDVWCSRETCYVALMTRMRWDKIFIMPLEPSESLNVKRLSSFIDANNAGTILLTNCPRFMQIKGTPDCRMLQFEGCPKILRLTEIKEIEGVHIYRYQRIYT